MPVNDEEKNRPLYMISVAAELTGMHPQTLRIYESKGLVNPRRSSGNTRLTDEGITLAGVVRILDLKSHMEERDAEIESLRDEVKALREQVHEYRMRETITALMPYGKEGGSNPLAGLLGGTPSEGDGKDR